MGFDMGIHGYSLPAFKILSQYFGSRFELHIGDSQQTVPHFAAKNPGNVSCDILLVDGDHRYQGALRDIMNLRTLAGCNATVLIDDIVWPPGKALQTALSLGVL